MSKKIELQTIHASRTRNYKMYSTTLYMLSNLMNNLVKELVSSIDHLLICTFGIRKLLRLDAY